jgi:hypothetical protein
MMRRSMQEWWQPAVLVGMLVTVVACGGSSEPAHEAAPQASTSAASTPQATAAASTPTPANVGDLFPAGEGRDAVLGNCSSCHSVACTVIGQRTKDRWDGLKESHTDRVPDPDLSAAFSYLKAHFDDTKPEPKVPPDFMAGGCTPPA